jgi:hypothetical protein
MPISRSKPPSTYVPYSYLGARGSTVASSIKLTDSNGNPIELSNTELLLAELISEVRALRIAVCTALDINIEPEDIVNKED